MVTAPEFAGAAPTGLDLVKDQQDAVLVRALPEASKKAFVAGHIATFAQYRLDDERRGLSRAGDGLQQVVELLEREVGGLLDPPSVVARVGERGYVYAAHQRTKTRAELGAAGRDDAAATVRPWKPPWNAMMLGRPVACRARRSAASTASRRSSRRTSGPDGWAAPRSSAPRG